MAHNAHSEHDHNHNITCGHTKIMHGDHIDYIHEGHLHHEHNSHWDECSIPVSSLNPDKCCVINCGCFHNENLCKHEIVPHGNHLDFLVDGRLHHVHGDHCDDHGPVEIISA